MRIFLGILVMFLCLPVAAQTSDTGADPSVPVESETAAPPNSELAAEAASLEAYVDGIVAAHRREHDAPGVAVSIVLDGQLLFAKGYGRANVEKGTPVSGQETLFRIGSVSKTFVWTLVMILQDRGLIDLDADVNTYLKDFQIPQAFGAPITMNDLMAHRAGFEDSLAGFNRSEYEKPQDGSRESDPRARRANYLAQTMPERIYPPGTRTSYSNWGASLTAHIVENVAGVPYEEFLKKEILEPLALKHTALLSPDWMTPFHRERLAVGYKITAGTEMAIAYMQGGRSNPAGGMSSTASDMARWMLMHLGRGTYDGATLMRPETHDLMWKRAFSDRLTGADVAHGFYTKEIDGVQIFGHGGATSAFFTDMTMVPSMGLGIYISQNTTKSRWLVTDLAPLVIRHLRGKTTPSADQQASPSDAAQFAGTYLNNRRVFTKFEKLMYSLGSATVTPAPGGGLFVSALAGGAQYYTPVPDAPGTFENRDGERLVFGRDESGTVTHFSDGSGFHSYERVDFTTNGTWLYLALGLALFFAATTLLGAWRRQGRGNPDKGVNALLGWGSLFSAGLVFAFTFALIGMAMQALGNIFDFFANYPPPTVTTLRTLGPVLCALAIAGLAGLLPAWRTASWSIFRKLHYSAFALSLGFLALMLIVWNVVFVPHS